MTWLVKLESAIERYSPRAPSVQIGRTIIAAAQILLLLGTSWKNLTPYVYGVPDDVTCSYLARVAIFCVVPDLNPAGIPRAVAVAILVAVCAGVVPRYTGFLHLWVSFSIGVSLTLPDGGEQVAQVATIAVAILLLGDNRLIAWRSERRSTAIAWLGVSYAGWWVLRLQMAGIYLQSSVAKFGVDDWLNGTAMYYVVRDPSFGATGFIGSILRAVTDTPLGTAALSWGAIAVEMVIGICVLLGPRMRRLALIASCLLHVGIILSIGLWTFGLIMIGAMTIATGRLEGARLPDDLSERAAEDEGEEAALDSNLPRAQEAPLSSAT
jgi:antimicrobial peptide system SdpB family protein